LLGEARAALPSDKRSYRGLKKKIDMALGLSSLTTKDPIPDVKSDTILPGSKAGDFEAWLYQQSNVTRDCQDLYLLTRLWRLDFEWHD
ncbi:unnamed protein product, partial [Laminaria digitata]